MASSWSCPRLPRQYAQRWSYPEHARYTAAYLPLNSLQSSLKVTVDVYYPLKSPPPRLGNVTGFLGGPEPGCACLVLKLLDLRRSSPENLNTAWLGVIMATTRLFNEPFIESRAIILQTRDSILLHIHGHHHPITILQWQPFDLPNSSMIARLNANRDPGLASAKRRSRCKICSLLNQTLRLYSASKGFKPMISTRTCPHRRGCICGFVTDASLHSSRNE